jgi:hypothetical protein
MYLGGRFVEGNQDVRVEAQQRGLAVVARWPPGLLPTPDAGKCISRLP